MACQSSGSFLKLPHAAVAEGCQYYSAARATSPIRHAFRQASAHLMPVSKQAMLTRQQPWSIKATCQPGSAMTSLRVAAAARLLFCTAGNLRLPRVTMVFGCTRLGKTQQPDYSGQCRFPAVQKRPLGAQLQLQLFV